MARSSRALAVGGTALVLAAAALAGCGDDDTGGTVTTTTAPRLSVTGAAAAYAPIRAEIVAIGRDLGTAVRNAPGTADAELADQFSALTVRAESAVARLESLDVPADLDTAFDDLREALSDGAEDLRAVATAARQHDPQAAREATQRLVSDSAAIRAARAQVERQLPPARG
ncbi:hypothetical protein [Conexibacter arvalis]|uniref:Ribosomal protein L12E/L44/L45/RPP1/RPP2 n=1 Tax=Conexibacter arvalis TaxID=912552 RepID=A0A840ILN7_9ACTN|nr:hypothetical protein [Conexibacter arvalis]MBB4664894.1 ribosomal protein L12E/L44/L45/RPP1/RPP2 [Conexibacter arvalis]